MSTNDNIISGKWKEIKGDIMRTWGKLSDDEVEGAKGNLMSLAGTVQQRFGLAQEEAARKLNGIVDKYRTEMKNDSDESVGTH